MGDQEVQTLFAFDTSRIQGDPIGVIIFLRACFNEITVIHVAVDPDYGVRSRHRELGLAVVLVHKVKEIAAQIFGVQQVTFLYRRSLVILLPPICSRA